MNSLEAIIALSALLAGFGVLLGVVVAQNNAATEAFDSIKAKSGAMACAEIIDALYSNSAQGYNKEFNCSAKDTNVYLSINGKTKSVAIITTAKKTSYLEVKTLEHYFE